MKTTPLAIMDKLVQLDRDYKDKERILSEVYSLEREGYLTRAERKAIVARVVEERERIHRDYVTYAKLLSEQVPGEAIGLEARPGALIVKGAEESKALATALSEMEVPDDTKAKEEAEKQLKEWNETLKGKRSTNNE